MRELFVLVLEMKIKITERLMMIIRKDTIILITLLSVAGFLQGATQYFDTNGSILVCW